MDSINISNWVRSALVVDDQWNEVKNLIQILNTNGVATSYYNPHPENAKSTEYIFDTSWLDELGDDESEAAKRHIEALNQQMLDIMAYTRMKSLADESLTGYSLIFLDIDFGVEHVTDVKNQVSYAVGILKKALSEESTPYGIVLWSKEPSYPHEGEDGDAESTSLYITKMLYGDGLEGKPKPLFVVDIEKSFFEGSGKYSELIQKINEKLSDNKMAKFFAYWNGEVLQSAALTCKDIQHYAETLAEEGKIFPETEFFNILKHATYAHYGFSKAHGNEILDILSRYSFGYMSNLLYDYLNSHFSLKNISGVFDDSTDIFEQDNLTMGVRAKDCHNSFCKILKDNGEALDEETHGKMSRAVEAIVSKCPETKIHKVIAELNYRTLFAPARPDVKELSGLIYSKNFTNKARILVNITPPCDIAQDKNKNRLYLTGRIFIFSTYVEAFACSQKKDGDRFFKTPPALIGGKYSVLRIDMKGIAVSIEDIFQANFLLKDSIFADLMQKFGQYNSRLGSRTFQ